MPVSPLPSFAFHSLVLKEKPWALRMLDENSLLLSHKICLLDVGVSIFSCKSASLELFRWSHWASLDTRCTWMCLHVHGYLSMHMDLSVHT